MWLVLLTLFLLLLAVFCVRYMTANRDVFRKLNIDSPPTNWLLGNLGDPIKQGLFENQIDLFNKYKDKKVYGVFNARIPSMIIKDLDLVKDITVKHFNNFVNRQTIIEFKEPFKESLLTLKDDHWKHVRNTVSPTFSSGRIKKMSQHVERHSKRLVDILVTKQEMNEDIELKDIISHFTLDVIASTGFGLEINTMENPENIFAVHAKKIIKPSPWIFVLAFISPWFMRLLKHAGYSILATDSLVFFTKVIDSAMENRKEKGQAGKVNDFLDLLINADHESGQTEKGSLTRSEIHGQTVLFILGGYDTISTVLSFTVFLLANHPECCERVQKEIDENLGNEAPNFDNVNGLSYLEMCISESIRLFPPGFNIDRVSSEDITLQGIHIPKDMVVTIPVYAIHHDPENWPEPGKFKPERFCPEFKESRHPYAYLPFGHGPRNCVGMRLALLELKVALAYILKTLTPVVCSKTVYPVKLDKFAMKSDGGLWVKLQARK